MVVVVVHLQPMVSRVVLVASAVVMAVVVAAAATQIPPLDLVLLVVLVFWSSSISSSFRWPRSRETKTTTISGPDGQMSAQAPSCWESRESSFRFLLS